MAKKVGELIKEARTGAGMTQAQLADKVKGLTASDISKAERGLKELSADQLKQIAKATGVTQSSLLNAAKGSAAAKPAKKPAAKPKKPASASSTSSTASHSMKVTASEKKLVELYRKADADTKKAAMKLLKGDQGEDLLNAILGNAVEMLFNSKK